MKHLYYIARKGRICIALAAFHGNYIRVKIAKKPGPEFPLAENSTEDSLKRIAKDSVFWKEIPLDLAQVIGDALLEAGDEISGRMILNAVERKMYTFEVF
jgi:hypothetical protein